MERVCPSCGRDPGAGAFCQHCGTRQPDAGPPATSEPTPQPPRPSPIPPQAPSAPTATPPIIAGQQVPSRGSGCRPGCLIASALALALVVIGGFLIWRFVNDNVLPVIDEASEAFQAFDDSPPGPCYDLETDGGLLTGWTEVSCSGPRQVEVAFAAFFEAGAFPGDDYLEAQARKTCASAFEVYVGIPHGDSIYSVDWLLPTEETWATGNRQGICLIVSEDGEPLTGTVKRSET